MTTPFPFVANTVLTAAQLNAVTTLPINARTASYTLVVGDVGYRVQMTNASATTITVNTGIFAAGDTIWIQNLGAGTCTITAGTATVTTASSLALAQWGGGTLVFQSASAATFFSQQASSYGVATGGASSSITVGGINYTLLTFTTDSSLVVSKSGLFDCLLVGGGNAGYAWAGGAGYAGGGGGAGGVVQQTIYLAAATYTVDIGAGAAGVAGNVRGTNGFPSTIGTGINAIAAAGGITFFPDNGATGAVGGELASSGGAHNSAASSASNNVQGNKGGSSTAITNAGGGGGFGAVGSNGSVTTGGAGGAGYDVSAFISGSALFKAGGGGGAGSGAGGAGGSSIGGAGVTSGTGNNGTANAGSGGGGSTNTGQGGNGSSGIIYVRFK